MDHLPWAYDSPVAETTARAPLVVEEGIAYAEWAADWDSYWNLAGAEVDVAVVAG